MGMPPLAFNDLLAKLDTISSAQTYKVILHLQEVAAGDVDPVKESIATFNSLTEVEVVAFLNYAKSQFNKEDWETLTQFD